MTVGQMLMEAEDRTKGLDEDRVQLTKEKVFNNLTKFIEAIGYPRDNYDHSEANVHDMAFAIIFPIFYTFRTETKRQLRLTREKEIISIDRYTGGYQEIVITDTVAGPKSDKYVLVVEAKKASLKSAKKQCLLALKDMGDRNRSVVYGFVTVGDVWQMIRYQNSKFTQTEAFHAAFRTMKVEKAKWMRESSVVIDLIHMALKSVGPTRAAGAAA